MGLLGGSTITKYILKSTEINYMNWSTGLLQDVFGNEQSQNCNVHIPQPVFPDF